MGWLGISFMSRNQVILVSNSEYSYMRFCMLSASYRCQGLLDAQHVLHSTITVRVVSRTSRRHACDEEEKLAALR